MLAAARIAGRVAGDAGRGAGGLAAGVRVARVRVARVRVARVRSAGAGSGGDAGAIGGAVRAGATGKDLVPQVGVLPVTVDGRLGVRGLTSTGAGVGQPGLPGAG